MTAYHYIIMHAKHMIYGMSGTKKHTEGDVVAEVAPFLLREKKTPQGSQRWWCRHLSGEREGVQRSRWAASTDLRHPAEESLNTGSRAVC